ncbi:hypothetical protein BpHYR1_009570 [Brachionus plicatilis]|uniref:Uncharacterized protein n=1 Tax=Brachionus plicatilis TaxID=10195 RepID=A0A3M7T8V1_BRAPC|nr:hypothetical protein BpHYR1_009570 [Brachionus plicatilis]
MFFLNSSFSGQIIEIRFKVKNVGFGVTKYANWFDCVDLKKANSSQRTINMAIFEHDGKLSSGSSYQSIKKIQIQIFVSFCCRNKNPVVNSGYPFIMTCRTQFSRETNNDS